MFCIELCYFLFKVIEYLNAFPTFIPHQNVVRTWCCSYPAQRTEMAAASVQLLFAAILWTVPYRGAAAATFSSPTDLLNMTKTSFEADSVFRNLASSFSVPRSRRRRAISNREVNALLDYHNRVRSQVSPPAANMEYMVSAVSEHCILYHPTS